MSDYECQIGRAFTMVFGPVRLEKCSTHLIRSVEKKMKSKDIRLFDELSKKNTIMSFFYKNFKQFCHVGISSELFNQYLDETLIFARDNSALDMDRFSRFIDYLR